MRRLLQFAGSIWLAAVVLLLLLVGMACATVFETTHGTEQTLREFYRSGWFELLLFLLGVNILCALLVRWPFSRRQVGFVVTHVSILIILVGTLVTQYGGIDGQVAVAEGQTIKEFTIPRDALMVVNRASGARTAEDLPTGTLHVDNLTVRVERVLADSRTVSQVADDNPLPQTAVEISLSESGRENPLWLFADAPAGALAEQIQFRAISDPAPWGRLLHPPATSRPSSKGTVRVEYHGAAYAFPLEAALGKTVKIGNTGLALHVLRYLPHATVGEDREITNASEMPVNPAIEAEISGPAGKEKRLAFARFPDFASMHKQAVVFPGLKLVLLSPADTESMVPIEIAAGPGGQLVVRFIADAVRTAWQSITPGTPVETPWTGYKFAILRRFDHARSYEAIVPVEPTRANRQPALLAKIQAPGQSSELWVSKGLSKTIRMDGREYELRYEDKALPLGFDLTLDRFHVGFYPGERQPRSFESHVTVRGRGGRSQSRVISMNNPLSYGGYCLYQSSYNQDGGKSVSTLSISWDPGKPIVFAGYFGLLAGMVLVLVTKRRRET